MEVCWCSACAGLAAARVQQELIEQEVGETRGIVTKYAVFLDEIAGN